jgi:GNAT superfamily N-acetyltransferase
MNNDLQRTEIRLITESDIPLFVKHRIDYLKELQGEPHEGREITLRNELENYFRKELSAKRFFAFLIEKNNQPVSFGAVVIKSIPGDFSSSVYSEGDILNMYTIPEARKKGFAGIILKALITESKKRGISKLSLHTTKDGEHLYRNSGFSEPAYPYLEMVIKPEAFCH